MKRKIVILSLALWSAVAFAVPSIGEVEAATKAGNYAQAETMMQEVVAAKPQSAKAHYVYAEILAHEGKFADADAQAKAAQGIDPSLSFTDAQRFRQFEQEIQRAEGTGQARVPAGYAAAGVPVQHASSGIPGWVWVVGIAVVGFLLLRAVTRRAQMASGGYMGGAQVYPAGQGGYGMPAGGPGYGYPGATGGGSSLLGTGLAAAGGVAAGMLAEKWLEGRREDENFTGNPNAQSWDNGAADAQRDLENRPVDFGNDPGAGWGGDVGGGSDTFTPDGGGGGDNGGGW